MFASYLEGSRSTGTGVWRSQCCTAPGTFEELVVFLVINCRYILRYIKLSQIFQMFSRLWIGQMVNFMAVGTAGTKPIIRIFDQFSFWHLLLQVLTSMVPWNFIEMSAGARSSPSMPPLVSCPAPCHKNLGMAIVRLYIRQIMCGPKNLNELADVHLDGALIWRSWRLMNKISKRLRVSNRKNKPSPKLRRLQPGFPPHVGARPNFLAVDLCRAWKGWD